MVEFTGERVVPGQVDVDLWSEHLARYAFARRIAVGKRVLDCGCGTGYGAAELAEDAEHVTGLDLSSEAIEFAQANYARPNTTFITGSGLEIPCPAESFDLVVAFELIEHITDFRRFLDECVRVLAPTGLFIASTPNKSYYAESRAQSGPNPFHAHEFEADEFSAEIARAFPFFTLIVQNRVECFAFPAVPLSPGEARLDADGGPLAEAHFFIALCSNSPLPQNRSFVYVPKAANLLRQREQHIQLLEDQLRRTQDWLTQTQEERNRMLQKYEALKVELEARNLWAQSLDAELKTSYDRIDQLQREVASEQQLAMTMAAGYESKMGELEEENVAKTRWALETQDRLGAEIDRLAGELIACGRLLQTAEDTVVERTKWAQRVELEKQTLQAQLDAVRASRWLKLGRKLGLGPGLH